VSPGANELTSSTHGNQDKIAGVVERRRPG
jgi:hypothetical protein